MGKYLLPLLLVNMGAMAQAENSQTSNESKTYTSPHVPMLNTERELRKKQSRPMRDTTRDIERQVRERMHAKELMDVRRKEEAEELFQIGMSIIQNHSFFLKGFAFLKASCVLEHKQACKLLEVLTDKVLDELNSYR